MKISVVVPTFNRAHYVVRSIASLAAQTLASREYEILVVDNACTDATRERVHAEFGHLANLRYLQEPVPGVSQARNAGWQASRGEYLAFLDDDTIAAPDWLARILGVFESATPRPGVVGGRVLPIWEAPRPPWLSDVAAGYLSMLDWGDVARPLVREQWLLGVNMALPRSLLEALGGFSTALGRQGAALLSGEETALQRRLAALGHTRYYDPAIVVQHHIQAARLNKAWMYRRAYWGGVSSALMWSEEIPTASWQYMWLLVRTGAAVLLPTGWVALLLNDDHPALFTRSFMQLNRLGCLLGLLHLTGRRPIAAGAGSAADG